MFALADYLIVFLIIGAAAFVHGYGGIGFGVISMTCVSFLTFGMERMSVVVNINSAVAMAILFGLARTRTRVDWRQAGLLLLGTAVGLPIGYWFIVEFGDRAVFRILLGLFLLYFAIDGAIKIHVPRHLPSWAGAGIGAISGFTSGAFISGGPPAALYLYSRVRDPRQMKATLQAVFMIGTALRLVLVAASSGSGQIGYSRDVVTLALAATPVCAGALALGHAFSHHGTPLVFKRCVYSLIAVFGMIILVRGVGMLGA